jgi:hypothetical protein
LIWFVFVVRPSFLTKPPSNDGQIVVWQAL